MPDVARLPGKSRVAATISNTRSSKTHSFVLCVHADHSTVAYKPLSLYYGCATRSANTQVTAAGAVCKQHVGVDTPATARG
jgi:hypothetical protein